MLLLIVASVACLGIRFGLSVPNESQRYLMYQSYRDAFLPFAYHFRIEHWGALFFLTLSGIIFYLVAIYRRWTCLLEASQIEFSTTYKSQTFWASMMFGVCDPWGVGAGLMRFLFTAFGSRRYIASLTISLAEASSSIAAFVFLGLVSFPFLLSAVDKVADKSGIMTAYGIFGLVSAVITSALLRPGLLPVRILLPRQDVSDSFSARCITEMTNLANAPRAILKATFWSLLAQISLLPVFVCIYVMYVYAAAMPLRFEMPNILQLVFTAASSYAQVRFDALLNRSTAPWWELAGNLGGGLGGFQLWIYYSILLLLGLAPMLLGAVSLIYLSTKGFSPGVDSQPVRSAIPRG